MIYIILYNVQKLAYTYIYIYIHDIPMLFATFNQETGLCLPRLLFDGLGNDQKWL